MTEPRKPAKKKRAKIARVAVKTPLKSPKPPVALRAGRNGGTLRSGGGNKGGTGRPPSVIRDRLRGSFDERITMLEGIADGQVVERVEVPLLEVLKHAGCPKCGDAIKADDVAKLVLVSVVGTRSASASERLKAADILAKYGLGTQQAITGEDGGAIKVDVRQAIIIGGVRIEF